MFLVRAAAGRNKRASLNAVRRLGELAGSSPRLFARGQNRLRMGANTYFRRRERPRGGKEIDVPEKKLP